MAVPDNASTPGDLDCLENILQSLAGFSWYHVRPNPILQPLVHGKHTPIRTGFSLQPLEVIDLVPLILRVITG